MWTAKHEHERRLGICCSECRLAFVAAVCALFAVGCQSEGERGNAVSCAGQALYGGSPDSDALALSANAQAAIVGIESSGGSLFCSGTFVTRDIVLTAAHCALASGIWIRRSSAEPPVAAARTRIHPNLDAMIVQLQPPAAAEPAGLALWPRAIGTEWVGARVTLAGFGRTGTGTTGALNFVEESVTDVQATELMVDGRGKSGGCDGDSGGPLLAHDADGEARILGVLSQGSKSCLGVDAYTRADLLAPWLAQLGVADRPCAAD